MYIFLDDDISKVDFSSNIDCYSSLENLINTGYEGINIIDMSALTYKYLLSNELFTNIFKGKLKQIIDFNREYQSLFDEINFKLIVSTDVKNISKVDKGWLIPLDYIKYGYLSGVDLIVEDNDDGRLLVHAVNHFQQSQKYLRSFPTSINIINGGGANILDTLSHTADNQKNLIICFCDSDKLSPLDDLGGVTNNCKRLAEELHVTQPVIFMHTAGREIENDLPHYFIEQTSSDDLGVISNFMKLKQIDDSICKEIFKYTDLKFGTSVEWIKRRPEGSKSKTFWLERVEILKENRVLPDSFELEISNNEELVVPAISQKMSEKIIRWLEYELKAKPKNIISIIQGQANSEAWFEHGKNLFWLALGGKKGRL